MDVLVTFLAGLLMLVGLVGVFVPVIPDMFLIWGAALGYGLLVGWGQWGPWLFALITLLGLIAVLAEVWVSGAGARLGGASIWGILAGLTLGVVGLITLTPIGGVAGMLLGTFLVEYLRVKDARKALRAMLGLGLGYGAAFGVKLALGLGMVAAWVVWAVTLGAAQP